MMDRPSKKTASNTAITLWPHVKMCINQYDCGEFFFLTLAPKAIRINQYECSCPSPSLVTTGAPWFSRTRAVGSNTDRIVSGACRTVARKLPGISLLDAWHPKT